MIVTSTMLLTVGLQLNQVAAESNYNQPYALPLNSRLGSLNEDILTSNEIKPFKTKGGQNIEGSFNTFQANPGSGAWSDFEALGGVNRDDSDPAIIANSNGRLEVFVVGTDNQLWHRWQTAPGSSTWSAWSSLGGMIAGSPAVTINSDGRLEVFVVGANGHALYHKWQTAPGSSTSWSNYASLGGTITGNPAVTRNSDGRLEAFAVGANGNALYHKWQTAPGSPTWSAWESLGSTIASNPTIGRNSDGRLEIFVIGADKQLWHKWQTSVGTGDPDLYDDFEVGSTYSLSDGQISPNGKWKSLYAGFRMTGVIQEPGNKHIHLEPMTSTSPGETHGAAVATTTSYKDFSLTLDVITKRQLRQNSPANNWETAWLNWNAIDQFHTYGFTLKVLGFQLEKKDNNNQDDGAEIYLVTQNSPSVKMNTWQTWQIMVSGTETGTPRIQVWIDGTKIVDYVDNNPAIPRNSETMKQGGPIALYTEDAAVGFDNVKITPL